MSVDVDQALEPPLAREFDERISVAVLFAEASTSCDTAVSLEQSGADLDAGRVVLADLEGLVEQVPGPLVLVVPSSVTTRTMKAALRTGVAGLVRESEIGASLAATVRAVRGGQLVVPLELGLQIAKPVLSRRQKQVLGLVVLGLSNGEIAAKLHLSEHTVKCHLYSGFRKLGVSSRDEAVATILDPESGLGTGILSISEAESEVAAHGHR